MSSSVSSQSDFFSSKSSTFGRIAVVFRRFLCSGRPPKSSSERIADAHTTAQNKRPDAEPSVGSPGILAKLMGLDSLRDLDLDDGGILTGPVARSRSMSSIDCYRAADEQKKGDHRRVKSHASFKDSTTYVELEDEEFFILSFEDGRESGGLEPRRRRCETRFEESRQGRWEEGGDRTEKWVNQGEMEEDEIEKNALNRLMREEDSIESSSLLKTEESNFRGEKLGKKSRRKKKKPDCSATDNMANECRSEDSSPVSVLDFDPFLSDQEPPKSETTSSRLEDTNPRRNLSTDLDICSPPSGHGDIDPREEDEKLTNRLRSRRRDWLQQNCMEIWSEICRMTETDIAASKWSHRDWLRSEERKKIAGEVASHVLDRLLEEALSRF